MMTSRKNIWYLHLLPEFNGQVSLKTDKRPYSVTLLRTGNPISYSYLDGFIKFKISSEYRTDMDDVIKVQL